MDVFIALLEHHQILWNTSDPSCNNEKKGTCIDGKSSKIWVRIVHCLNIRNDQRGVRQVGLSKIERLERVQNAAARLI